MVCFRRGVLVSCRGSPSGRDLNQIWPVFAEIPKLPGPRRNAIIFPSRDSVGISAASLKLVSCSQRSEGIVFSLEATLGHKNLAVMITATTPVATAAVAIQRRDDG